MGTNEDQEKIVKISKGTPYNMKERSLWKRGSSPNLATLFWSVLGDFMLEISEI